ncbi:hypothetical protein FRC02_004410 [Tulasnella sp. 418]|nr:hypothetical protein FRC02_004410 [Tulasnella sp. 418]
MNTSPDSHPRIYADYSTDAASNYSQSDNEAAIQQPLAAYPRPHLTDTGYSPQPSTPSHTLVNASSPPRLSQDVYAPYHHRRNSYSTQSLGQDKGSTHYTPSSFDGASVMDDANSLTGFDESVLRALCDLDCGVPLLLDRIKQSMVSCRETSTFFKKRAIVEEEYGRSLQKAARSALELYSMNEGKAGSFVTAWQSTMRLHEVIAENRLKFAQRLNEMADELTNLSKEVDKNRKSAKELASRYERALTESEMTLDKSKTRFEATHDELERILLAKEGESLRDGPQHQRNGGPSGGKRAIGKAAAKGAMLLKGKNPVSIVKQEEDVRSRMSTASDAYRKAVLETQQMRQEYFNLQLPKILRQLKECADEIDLGTQYHWSRYAFLFETTVLNDGSTLVPTGIEDGPGIKPIVESIDNRTDFKVYMQNYAIANNRPMGPRREGPADEGFLPPLPRLQEANEVVRIGPNDPRPSMSAHGHTNGPGGSLVPAPISNGHVAMPSQNPTNSLTNGHFPPGVVAAIAALPDRGRPTFGVDLTEQMIRDAVEVPRIVQRCCEAIEAHGLESVGIYRLSGTTSKVQKLKMMLDRDVDGVNLNADEWRLDVNIVASVLKLWLRELPEPLLTFGLYHGYIEAAKTENDRLRHIQLHHRVNDLPDANYATLKYLMGHLHKIREKEATNQMSVMNLSIVFGPTLLGPPPTSTPGGGMNGSPAPGTTLQDMNWQCRAIETILEHYTDIFVDENEEAAPATAIPSHTNGPL